VIGVLYLCSFFGPLLIALITCLVCRRHDVLLWLGGGILAGSVGGCLLFMCPAGPVRIFAAMLLALVAGAALVACMLCLEHDMPLLRLGGGSLVVSVAWVSTLIGPDLGPGLLGWPEPPSSSRWPSPSRWRRASSCSSAG
jgi:drug/metabolite transporter (DMT)-like permease